MNIEVDRNVVLSLKLSDAIETLRVLCNPILLVFYQDGFLAFRQESCPLGIHRCWCGDVVSEDSASFLVEDSRPMIADLGCQ